MPERLPSTRSTSLRISSPTTRPASSTAAQSTPNRCSVRCAASIAQDAPSEHWCATSPLNTPAASAGAENFVVESVLVIRRPCQQARENRREDDPAPAG